MALLNQCLIGHARVIWCYQIRVLQMKFFLENIHYRKITADFPTYFRRNIFKKVPTNLKLIFHRIFRRRFCRMAWWSEGLARGRWHGVVHGSNPWNSSGAGGSERVPSGLMRVRAGRFGLVRAGPSGLRQSGAGTGGLLEQQIFFLICFNNSGRLFAGKIFQLSFFDVKFFRRSIYHRNFFVGNFP